MRYGVRCCIEQGDVMLWVKIIHWMAPHSAVTLIQLDFNHTVHWCLTLSGLLISAPLSSSTVTNDA
jgi:hypothetical protein